MRITSNAMQRETLAAIRNSMSGLAEAQRRVTTGKRVHEPSDDPVAADGILRTARHSRALEQYTRNIDGAESRLRAEEDVLTQVTDLLTRARELGHMVFAPGVGDQEMDAILEEVESLEASLVSSANTSFGGGYLFGGNAPEAPPFEAAGPGATVTMTSTAVGEGGHQVDIGGAGWFATNHNGKEVFEDTELFQAFADMTTALENRDRDGVSAAMSRLDTAFQGVQTVLADVGARTNRLQVARANVEALDLNLQTLRSDLEDVDIEEAVSQLVGRQMAYQSALLATSKIMSTTLTDYLR